MYKVLTDKPIATDSLDHREPCGVRNDNTINAIFVDKMIKYYYQVEQRPVTIRYLDLGCAGGGLVKQFLNLGHNAIGIDGSDFRQKHQLPEWNTISDNLFTADITEPFKIYDNNIVAIFDIIALWEVMEHIPEDKIPQLILNIKQHLSYNGFLMVSISKDPQPHHVNIKEFDEWDKLFERYGFVRQTSLENYIEPDFPRGPNQKGDSGSPRVMNNIRRVYRCA